jgi:hypothetical protein
MPTYTEDIKPVTINGVEKYEYKGVQHFTYGLAQRAAMKDAKQQATKAQ